MLSPSIVTPNDTPKCTVSLGAAPPKRFATESFVIGACAPFAWPGRRSGDVNCTDMMRWIYGIIYIYISISLLSITCVYMNKYIYIISIYLSIHPSIHRSLSLSSDRLRFGLGLRSRIAELDGINGLCWSESRTNMRFKWDVHGIWIDLREKLQEASYFIGKSMVSCRFSLKPIH